MITSTEGLVGRRFPNLSNVEFLTPPFGDGKTVVLGRCAGDGGGPEAILRSVDDGGDDSGHSDRLTMAATRAVND